MSNLPKSKEAETEVDNFRDNKPLIYELIQVMILVTLFMTLFGWPMLVIESLNR